MVGVRRVLIRADASPAIGGGHVMRCLALAKRLSEQEVEISFACTAETLTVVPALSAHASVIIVKQFDDIEELTQASDPYDWGIVDHYRLAAEHEKRLRASCDRIMVIDDLANRAHDCDLLLDQNIGRTAGDYQPLVPEGTEVLAGTGYALLRPEFARLRAEALMRRSACSPARRLLVSMGLTDVGGITGRLASALMTHEIWGRVDVVGGGNAPSLDALKTLAARDPRLIVHVDSQEIGALMVAADVAIGAAGTSSWERCCLGLPTLILVLADNQRNAAGLLAAQGAALRGEATDLAGAAQLAVSLAADGPALHTMAQAAASLCDGFGVERVVARLCERTMAPALGGVA